jgi:hypothetical protein
MFRKKKLSTLSIRSAFTTKAATILLVVSLMASIAPAIPLILERANHSAYAAPPLRCKMPVPGDWGDSVCGGSDPGRHHGGGDNDPSLPCDASTQSCGVDTPSDPPTSGHDDPNCPDDPSCDSTDKSGHDEGCTADQQSCPGKGDVPNKGNPPPTKPITCPEGYHQIANKCILNTPVKCPTGDHREGNICVPNTKIRTRVTQ